MTRQEYWEQKYNEYHDLNEGKVSDAQMYHLASLYADKHVMQQEDIALAGMAPIWDTSER